MHSWQTTQFPSCNILHDIISSPTQLSYINEGSKSIVFEITLETNHGNNGIVLKTQLDYESFGPKAHEQRRQDAVVQERLTSSPYIMPIYAFCAMSTLAPLAAEGTLQDYMHKVQRGGQLEEPLPKQKLRIAVQLAEGLAALHNIDKDGRPSVAHGDIDLSQHVYHDGIFKLNDFNYARMLLLQDDPNNNATSSCKGSKSEMRAWMYRSPEELAYIYDSPEKRLFHLDKADVFSMGTELYIVLTNKWPWEGDDAQKTAKRLIAGERSFPVLRKHGNEKAIKAIVQSLEMCWIHDPEKRATAQQVASFLRKELTEIEKGTRSAKVGADPVRIKLPPLKDVRDD